MGDDFEPGEQTIAFSDPGDVTMRRDSDATAPQHVPTDRLLTAEQYIAYGRKRAVAPIEFLNQAEQLEAAARKLRVFARRMNELGIESLEYDGANSFYIEVEEQLKRVYRRARQALVGHPKYDEEVV